MIKRLPIPPTVAAFELFKERLGLSWDDELLYIKTNGLPDHDMIWGITAWQQQVPLPSYSLSPHCRRGLNLSGGVTTRRGG